MRVRDHDDADEAGWLRCRVLSFLDTAYYADVVLAKPRYPQPSVELVAVSGGQPIGIVDAVAGADALATIETIAVHPDHRRSGAGSALVAECPPRLAALGASTVDAWTRDDEGALRWYRRNGFTETERYVHVHATAEECAAQLPAVPGAALAGAFLHFPLARERELRALFRRVYVCRRFVRPVS